MHASENLVESLKSVNENDHNVAKLVIVAFVILIAMYLSDIYSYEHLRSILAVGVILPYSAAAYLIWVSREKEKQNVQ